jgi:DNA-binding CsgD family transcriptional regulator
VLPDLEQKQMAQTRWLKGGLSNYAIGKTLRLSAPTAANYGAREGALLFNRRQLDQNLG